MVLKEFGLKRASLWKYKWDIYSYIDLSNSSISELTAAWWNYRGDTPSFNASWAYLPSAWKVWIYNNNIDLSNVKKIKITSNWRFVPSADMSLWFQDQGVSNYYYGYKGKLVGSYFMIGWNDSARASKSKTISTWDYLNTFEVDFTTWLTTYTENWDSLSYTLRSDNSELPTVKIWTYIWAWFESYSSSVWTNWNIIKDIEIIAYN